MIKMGMKFKLIILLFTFVFFTQLHAEQGDADISFYTGTFDFSDEGKKSTLFGIQHINTGKNKESFLGILLKMSNLSRSISL